jgi:hypothetical protein
MRERIGAREDEDWSESRNGQLVIGGCVTGGGECAGCYAGRWCIR